MSGNKLTYYSNLLIPFFLSFVAVSFLSDTLLFTLIIVLGQAHFLATYIYQGRAKKINYGYLVRFLCLFLLFGGVTLYYYENSFFRNLFTFITLLTFVYHYSKDEFKLHSYEDPHSLIEGKIRLYGVVSLVVVYFPFLLKHFFPVSESLVIIFSLVSFLCVSFLAWFFLQAVHTPKNYIIPILFVLCNVVCILLATFIYGDISVYQIAGFIILYHYIRWYLYYALKFVGNDWSFYFRTVLVCNVLSLLGFVFYSINDQFNVLRFLYEPIFFYCWTLLHILLTIRKDDFIAIKN